LGVSDSGILAFAILSRAILLWISIIQVFNLFCSWEVSTLYRGEFNRFLCLQALSFSNMFASLLIAASVVFLTAFRIWFGKSYLLYRGGYL
jgi:hypothetical protein